MRSHLRTESSALGATLAISMLDTAGINIDRIYHLGLTQVDIQLYESAVDVGRLHTIGSVLREGRTQVFTECRFEDADQPGRVIGSGSANWAVINATPEGFVYTDPGPGYEEGPEVPAMAAAYELEPLPAGGFVLPRLSARVGLETLHHGPMLVGLEQSALQIVSAITGTDRLLLQSMSVRIPRAGRRGPFTFGAEVLASVGSVIGCRAKMTDGDDNVVAVSLSTYRLAS
ncbi:MAG TPA: hypothetical protein VMM60_01710 [Ilumatobacter sp.]|nr:hypothetical protein [Ilumatobacter sp.]